jgi:hypothetical protein
MRAIRLLRISCGFGCVLFAMSAATSFASIILRTPGNDSIATAQNLDGYFSRDFNPDIGDAEHGIPSTSTNTFTTIPHATVLVPPSSPRPIPSFDFYSFTVPVGGGLTILDVDYAGKGGGPPNTGPFVCPSYFLDCDGGAFDSDILLINSSGAFVATNDDADFVNGAGGSFVNEDPFLQLFLAPGQYFVEIKDFGLPLRAGETYALQVSVEGHAIPEPPSLLLLSWQSRFFSR